MLTDTNNETTMSHTADRVLASNEDNSKQCSATDDSRVEAARVANPRSLNIRCSLLYCLQSQSPQWGEWDCRKYSNEQGRSNGAKL